MKLIEQKLNEGIDLLRRDIGRRLNRIVERAELLLEDGSAYSPEVAPKSDFAKGANFEEPDTINQLLFQLHAAKRAMGLLNDLPVGPYRKKHAQRIFANFNKLRGLFVRMEKELVQREFRF